MSGSTWQSYTMALIVNSETAKGKRRKYIDID